MHPFPPEKKSQKSLFVSPHQYLFPYQLSEKRVHNYILNGRKVTLYRRGITFEASECFVGPRDFTKSEGVRPRTVKAQGPIKGRGGLQMASSIRDYFITSMQFVIWHDFFLSSSFFTGGIDLPYVGLRKARLFTLSLLYLLCYTALLLNFWKRNMLIKLTAEHLAFYIFLKF